MEEELLQNQIELEELKIQYEELKIAAQEDKIQLQNELDQQEKQIKRTIVKFEEVQIQNEELNNKLKIKSEDISKLQQQISQLQQDLSKYQKQKRELEILNDNWENEARILTFSKQDLEQKLEQAEEEAVIYKEELDAMKNARQEEIQRLMDQIRELQDEMQYLKKSEDETSKVRILEIESDLLQLKSEKKRISQSFKKPLIQRQILKKLIFNQRGTDLLQDQDGEKTSIAQIVPLRYTDRQRSKSSDFIDDFFINLDLNVPQLNDQKTMQQFKSFVEINQIQSNFSEINLNKLQKQLVQTQLATERPQISHSIQPILKPATPKTNKESIQFQSTNNKIQIYCRVKPISSKEENKASYIQKVNDQQLSLFLAQEKQQSIKNFYFDKILDQNTTEKQLYIELKNVILHAIDGGTSCVLAYGETGSGKTYSIQQLLHSAGEFLSENKFKIKIQIFEIHNETVKNLLSEEVACSLQDVQT